MKRLITVLSMLAFFSSAAAADVIIFRSGSAKEGIIEEETPTSVRIRIKKAVVGVSRDNIERIEYATPEENKKLDQKWKEQEEELAEERRRKREEKEKFEQQQRDRGLEKVGDKWVTRKQKARAEQEKIRGQIREQEAARAAEAQRLAEEEAAEAEESGEDFSDIVLGEMEVTRHPGGNLTALGGKITNNGQLTAGRIYLQVVLYDSEGNQIYGTLHEVMALGPNESRYIHIPFKIAPGLVAGSNVFVRNVLWKQF